MDIIQLKDPKKIKAFIETADYQVTSYLYKIPQQFAEFDHLLEEAIKTPGAFAISDNNQIKALIIAISYETHKFKIIGPFIEPNFDVTPQLFQNLFNAMTENQPDNAIYNFSFEEGVQTYKPFIKQIKASYNFTDYYLEAHQVIGELENEQNIIEYQKGFHRALAKMHHKTFKHDAMKADDIVNTLDENNKLFLFVSEGLLKGYLYLHVNPQKSKAEIKHFSSHIDYRMKGIAFDLLEYALHYAFSHYELHKVYFKIRNKNSKLVERFNELGFTTNYEYKKYKLEPQYIHENATNPET
ncbi:GNAT family N-acetyltransferase [Staphylococcus sp. FSL H8-0121]|uniref:GNAT family N-acetyltransferase n=1 Tax=Staphylococcus sp. FSL H8-0121 TaxID=2921377 RepID=UPI0030F8522A